MNMGAKQECVEIIENCARAILEMIREDKFSKEAIIAVGAELTLAIATVLEIEFTTLIKLYEALARMEDENGIKY